MATKRSFPGALEKRGNSYRVRLCVDGQRHRFTLRGVTEKEAREFARTKHRELEKEADRRGVGLPTGVTAAGLFDRFENEVLPTLTPGTQRSYGDLLKPFRCFFVERLDSPKLTQIRPGHVREFLTWRRTRGGNGKRRAEPLSNRTWIHKVSATTQLDRPAKGLRRTDEPLSFFFDQEKGETHEEVPPAHLW